MRLHNGPRYEEIRIKANYNIAARIRFSLTAGEIFNAKGKDLAIAQRFRSLILSSQKVSLKSLEYRFRDTVTMLFLPTTAAIIS